MSSFSDPKAIVGYAENTIQRVPGLKDIHRMSALLLAERTPTDGHILVVGAGGGMELTFFAQSFPNWRFDGVDPSPAMLAMAEASLGSLNSRVQLHQGYIDTAPKGPFDGATCLLTLHFTDKEYRYRTLCEIHSRMKPGGAFVAVHYSISKRSAERELWLSRCAEFATLSGIGAVQAHRSVEAIGKQLPILSPEEDKELMQRAGFTDISTFYIGLGFRGWIAYA